MPKLFEEGNKPDGRSIVVKTPARSRGRVEGRGKAMLKSRGIWGENVDLLLVTSQCYGQMKKLRSVGPY
jgi:hypothetical protein